MSDKRLPQLFSFQTLVDNPREVVGSICPNIQIIKQTEAGNKNKDLKSATGAWKLRYCFCKNNLGKEHRSKEFQRTGWLLVVKIFCFSVIEESSESTWILFQWESCPRHKDQSCGLPWRIKPNRDRDYRELNPSKCKGSAQTCNLLLGGCYSP